MPMSWCGQRYVSGVGRPTVSRVSPRTTPGGYAWRSGIRWLAPECRGRQASTFGHGAQLGPDNLRFNLICRPGKGAKAAISPGNDVLLAHDFGIAHQSLCHQLRMLDKVSGGVQHPGDEDLIPGWLDIPEHRPLVFVAGIGAFKGDGLGARLQHNMQNILERNVAVMRPFVVAPAQVQAKPV